MSKSQENPRVVVEYFALMEMNGETRRSGGGSDSLEDARRRLLRHVAEGWTPIGIQKVITHIFVTSEIVETLDVQWNEEQA